MHGCGAHSLAPTPRAAKAFGIKFPDSILLRADKLIE